MKNKTEILKLLEEAFYSKSFNSLWIMKSCLEDLGIQLEFKYWENPKRIYCETRKLLGKSYDEHEKEAIARENELRERRDAYKKQIEEIQKRNKKND